MSMGRHKVGVRFVALEVNEEVVYETLLIPV